MDDPTYMNTETSKTGAIYWPAEGKLLARITLDGKFVAIFKAPPTDAQGHAMAKAIGFADGIKWPAPVSETFWDGTHDAYGEGYNKGVADCKEAAK